MALGSADKRLSLVSKKVRPRSSPAYACVLIMATEVTHLRGSWPFGPFPSSVEVPPVCGRTEWCNGSGDATDISSARHRSLERANADNGKSTVPIAPTRNVHSVGCRQ